MNPKRSFGCTDSVHSTTHHTKPHKLVKEAPQSELLAGTSRTTTVKGVVEHKREEMMKLLP
jgi:hypothetical protein